MIPDCPGLSRPKHTFTDAARHVHDLSATNTLTYKEAAADLRLSSLGFATPDAISELVTAGRLYPVFRKNPRAVFIFDCALTDFRHRALTAPAPRSRA